MSRALRYAPPLADRWLIVRPRLLAPLRFRFQRRLTVVVAAAGFGKTTLLTQAVSENALSPLGDDRWLTCQQDDAALSFLAAGAFAAVGLTQPVPEDPHAAAVAVAEAIWSAAPRHVALILDDVHLIAPGSAGARFLTDLVEELPRNGHVVLASRPPLPLSTSRLVANGDAVVLGERDMHFRDAELASFAESRGVPLDLLSEVGGWPALAELTATAGPYAVTGYVWEELLSQLTPDRRHALAVLVAVGGADDEIAAALLGPDTRLDVLLDGLPLVVRARTGWWSLHGLWAAALHHHLDAGQVAQVRRVAAAVLRRRRHYHDAMELLLAAAAWNDVRDLVVDVCEVFTSLVPADVLQGWLHRLPPEVQRTPEGLLLAGMVVEPTNPGAAEQLLEQALAAAPATAAVRHACLNALVLLAFWRADRAQMKLLVQRLEELARIGHVQAAGVTALLRALLAADAARVRGELAVPRLASGAPLSPWQDWLHAHIVLLRLGDPEAAEPLARRSLSHAHPTMQAVSRCELLESFRMRGRLGEAERLLPALLADMTSTTVLCSPELLTCAVVLLSILGRHEQAEELLHDPCGRRSARRRSPGHRSPPRSRTRSTRCRSAARRRRSPRSGPSCTCPSCAARPWSRCHRRPCRCCTCCCRRHGRAGTSRRLPAASGSCSPWRSRWSRCASTARSRRSAGCRSPLDGTCGPCCRPHGRASSPSPWSPRARRRGARCSRTWGRRPAAPCAPRAGRRSPPVAATAHRLLREIPAVPSYRLDLRVLGPLELRRDGGPVAAPELRRERVRQLLAYLVGHDRPTRTAVTADLWPDFDETAAGRNLRVTLTYLQSVLEPGRSDPDPPYFLRSSGPVLHLVVDGPLVVDAREFERYLDEAAVLERQGVPSAALDAYQRALDLWRGDYLADVPHGDWLELERDRFRERFVATAVRAGQLLHARGQVAEARVLAERALRTDPWSEGAHQLRIAAQLAAGDLVGAHRSMDRCRQMLRELGVPPQQQTIALARRLQAAR